MEIKITDRRTLEQIAKEPFKIHTVLISICDVGKPFPCLENKPDHSLFLRFDDLYVPETMLSIQEKDICDYSRRFSWSQAQKIADFVKEYGNEAKQIICQCEYGESRSAAVAAAIQEHINGCGEAVFNDLRYHPNPGVYRMTLTALKQKNNEQMKII